MNQSEIARIRENIAREYQSVQHVFGGFTPTAKHEFITRRQECIAGHFEELKKHMSPGEAMEVLIQITSNDENTYGCPGNLSE